MNETSIRIGNYIIRSDGQCMWVDEIYINKKGFESTRKVAGYSRNAEELYKSFVDAKMRNVDANTTEAFLRAVSDLRGEILDLWKEMHTND